MDLTYPADQLGNGGHIVPSIIQGKAEANQSIIASKNPFFLFGINALQREDGASLKKAFNIVNRFRNEIHEALDLSVLPSEDQALWKKALSTKRKFWHNIARKGFIALAQDVLDQICLSSGDGSSAILHSYASTPGAWDLGFIPGKTTFFTKPSLIKNENSKRKEMKMKTCIYFLGADTQQILGSEEEPFIIYQGHHGNIGAKQANVILPSLSYVEKKGTYVNTEGRVQQTRTAVQSGSEARDDWKILEALSDYCFASAFSVNAASFPFGIIEKPLVPMSPTPPTQKIISYFSRAPQPSLGRSFL
jgi:hypothetical protein